MRTQQEGICMSFTAKETMHECPELWELISSAVNKYHDANGGWPRRDRVTVTITVSRGDSTSSVAGYASGEVTGIGHWMDKVHVEAAK